MSTFMTPTSKGQVTIKKTLLKHLGVRPGQRIEAIPAPDGSLRLVAEKPKHDISAIFGLLHRPGETPMTLEEMDQAIMDAVEENDRRTMSS